MNTAILTRGALEILDEDQQFSVLCHEIGHLRESRSAKLLRAVLPVSIAVMPGVIVWMQTIELMHYYVVLILTSVIALLLFGSMWLSRRLERAADQHALESAVSPQVYARSLELLYEHNRIPAVIKGSTSHPNLYDRLIAAGVTPEYERPQPPSQWGVTFALYLSAALFVTPLWIFDRGVDALITDLATPDQIAHHFVGLDDHSREWTFLSVLDKLKEAGHPELAYAAAKMCMEHAKDTDDCWYELVELLYDGVNCPDLEKYFVDWVQEDGEEIASEVSGILEGRGGAHCGITTQSVLAALQMNP